MQGAVWMQCVGSPWDGVSLGVRKAGEVNCEEARGVKAVEGWGVAGQEEVPLCPLPFCSAPLPECRRSCCCLCGAGAQGTVALLQERSPQRGFAAWPGRERAGQRGGTPCTQGTRLRLPPAARSPMV